MRLAVPIVALLLAATACTSDAEPEEPAAAAPTTSPSSSADAPPEPLPDPVTWFSRGDTCTELSGPVLMSDEVRFSRPVTVTGMSAVGLTHGLRIGQVSISAVPQGMVPISGGWRGDQPAAKWRDDLAWDDRRPIVHAHLDAGKYYFFIPVDIRAVPARYDGFELTWTDGSDRGSSTWHARDVYRETCA